MVCHRHQPHKGKTAFHDPEPYVQTLVSSLFLQLKGRRKKKFHLGIAFVGGASNDFATHNCSVNKTALVLLAAIAVPLLQLLLQYLPLKTLFLTLSPTMALAFAGKAVAVSAISAIVRKSFDYLDKYTKAERMKPVEERLERTLLQVQVVFDAIDMERIRGPSEALDAWIWQLRDAVEEAEDVLDDVEYYKLEKKVKSRGNMVSSSLYKCKRMFIQQFNTMLKVGDFKRMVDALKKLDEVASAVDRFIMLVDRFDPSSLRHMGHQGIGNPRETSSFLFDGKIVGRDTERDQVVEWLVKQESDGVQKCDVCSVTTYAIVGIGGMGKTTLAQAVYNNQRVKQCFDQIMWVCVSNEFDVLGLTRKIVQEITGQGTDITSLNSLQEILKGKLSSKKFLLVFDDVWNDERRPDWEKLVAPLKFGQRGSKLLLTTRMQSVVDIVERVLGGRAESLRLEGLHDNDLFALLNKHAFFGVNPDDYMNLQDIGQKIIKKLSGSPLAAKVLGGLLNNSMDSTYWNRMLRENISSIEHGNEGVMKVLRLSYHHLPPHLQACFRYCSMFREDYRFSKADLVQLWMGSGLIQLSADEDQIPEDVGEHYLRTLTRKSFFELHSQESSDMSHHGDFSLEYYVMHDLLHDLGRTVSKKECIRTSSDDYGSIPRTVRHAKITVVNHTSFMDFSVLKKLRTLLISFDETIQKRDQWIVLEKVLKVATKLRVLHVQRSSLFKLPDAFGNLTHLRYLCHSGPRKEVAKYSFWCPLYKLYHLQRIELNRCLLLSCRLQNLVNLRYLFFSGNLIGFPPYFGHLTSLQELNTNMCVPPGYGFLARELEDLKGLRHLYASGLENVSAQEGTSAKLGEKESLIMLSLSWDSGQLEADGEELLNSLQPHTNLEKLKIQRYNGMKSPCWMENPMLTNLTYVSLSDCNNWQHLPPLGGLPSLKYLYLQHMNAVKRIEGSFYGCEVPLAFPSLKLLSIQMLPSLEEWVGSEDMVLFPQLEKLFIRRCRLLRNIPALPSTLAHLEIRDAGLSTLPATYHPSEASVHQKPVLSRLNIYDCPNLVTLGQEYCFLYLEELYIAGCKNLLHLPMDKLQTPQLLKSLTVRGCPKLTALQEDISLPSSIVKLHIYSCVVYGAYHVNSLCSLTSLSTLCLEGDMSLPSCNRVTTAAPEEDMSLPSSIRELSVVSCGVYETCLLNSLCGLTCLTTLCLHDCEVTALPSADVFRGLRAVQHLEIVKCRELAALDGIEELASLTELIVYGCEKLLVNPSLQQASDTDQIATVSPSHLGRLEKLRISNPFLLQWEPLSRVNSVTELTIDNSSRCLPEEWLMKNSDHLKHLGVLDASQLEFLPSVMARLPSLATLEFKRAILVLSLPELPASLQFLQILGCHPVLKQRCRKRRGHDWHKVAHIPDLRIVQDLPSSYIWHSFAGIMLAKGRG